MPDRFAALHNHGELVADYSQRVELEKLETAEDAIAAGQRLYTS
jgi:hypothetical protein